MGDEATGPLGVWLLRSAYLERVDTGEKIFQYGESPRGVLILDEGGRMAAIITPADETGDAPARRSSSLIPGATGSSPRTVSSPTSTSPGFRAGSERRTAGPSRFETARSTL